MRFLIPCAACGESKPPSEFYARQDRPGRDRPHCRDCHKAMTREWTQLNPELARATKRRYLESHREQDRERSRRYRAKLKAGLTGKGLRSLAG